MSDFHGMRMALTAIRGCKHLKNVMLGGISGYYVLMTVDLERSRRYLMILLKAHLTNLLASEKGVVHNKPVELTACSEAVHRKSQCRLVTH